MDVFNIKDFKNGWFIGNFTPSILPTAAFEVAHHHHPKGYKGEPHTHKVATEVTYIVNGVLNASGKVLVAGEMFIYHPNEIADVTFLEDTDLIVIKWPSVPNDKFAV